MRIHAIQTGTVSVKTVQVTARSGNALLNLIRDRDWTEPLPIYAYLIEHPEGLILVDTGETARTAERGYWPRWHPFYRYLVREWVSPEDEIGNQLQILGFLPDDVRYVITTHFHTDHMGGLGSFPRSEHLVSRLEYHGATAPLARLGGSLAHRWPRWFDPTPVDFHQKPLGPFSESYPLTKAGDVHLLPTPGHTPGHLSVLVQTANLDYFIAGDVSYTEALMLEQKPDGVTFDLPSSRRTLGHVRDLCLSRPTVYLPAHDPEAGERLKARQVVREAREQPEDAVRRQVVPSL